MNRKKLLAAGLAAAMAVSLAACGGQSSSGSSTASQSSSGTSAEVSSGAASSGTGAAAASSADSTAADTSAATSSDQSASRFSQPNTDPVNTQKTDSTLYVLLSSEPANLWCGGSGTNENSALQIGQALLDTLVRKDYATDEIVPNLATDWEWVDGTHLKMNLRDDVTMSDGTPLVADDVVYTVNTWMSQSPNTDTGRYFAGAVADGDHTVTLEFNVQSPGLLDVLSWSSMGIVSEDEVNALGGYEAAAKNPQMGSGRYKFKEWKSGQNITLERNEDYWNPDYAGYYKEIVIQFTSDPASREMAVESGDAQVALEVPVSQAATYAGNDALNVSIYSYGQIAHLWYNMTDAHTTSDLAVRQAVDKALDFDAIAQVGTAGAGQPSLGYFPENGKYYNQTFTTEERVCDPDGAKQLLEDAGYATDGSLTLTALCLQDAVPVFTVIQENLRAAGITLEINTPDTPTFVQSAFAGDYDLINIGEYTAERYPTTFTFMQKANIEGGKVIGGPKYTTDELDADITQLIEEMDDAKAKEEIANVEQILKNDMYQSNLYPQMEAVITGSNVKGLTTVDRGKADITTFYEE